ncbi:MAG: GNAT family N-acetyltransferase [Chitinophagaceae bacterium]|nr:GNAT family N-acetyltransferase [Chitinophagaceae bacterium]
MTDAEDIFAFTSNPIGKEFLSWEPHENLERTQGFVHFLQENYNSGEPVQWGIELVEENRIIGITGFIDYLPGHNRSEIAFIMSPDYEGMGYMTEANTAVMQYGFETVGLHRIQAKAEVGNVGSQKVLEKIGMEKEGLLKHYLFQKGAYRDYYLYSKLSH